MLTMRAATVRTSIYCAGDQTPVRKVRAHTRDEVGAPQSCQRANG